MNSKTVLYSNNMNSQMPMASTTKIMTCLLACESEKLNQTIVVTDAMLDGVYGSLIYLTVGDEIRFVDLIKGAMLASGNDAANALAVAISGSVNEFVKAMNKRAVEFGMNNTSFSTPSGLDSENHYSTAYDMALLTANAMENNLFKSICKLQSATIEINGSKQTIYNHNKLLQVDGFVGVKTGYTDKAQRCLVSAYECNDNTIIIVTLNASDDWNDHKKLAEYSAKKYKHIQKNYEFNIDVVGANVDSIKCNANVDLYSVDDIKTIAYYYPFVYAPVKRNCAIGKLEVYSNNELIMTVDIIVKEDVKLWQITK